VNILGRWVVLVAVAAVHGCTPPATYGPVPTEAPPPQTEVFFYPSQGQAPAQQDRDRYECYLWAVRQSGFDPSQVNLAPTQRVFFQPQTPPGAAVAAGAVAGAVVGAAIGAPHDEAEGAVIGAIAGGALGAAAESADQAETARIQGQYDARADAYQARQEAQALAYRRAMTACLEGRGYAVR
jgi:hypothetical protein